MASLRRFAVLSIICWLISACILAAVFFVDLDPKQNLLAPVPFCAPLVDEVAYEGLFEPLFNTSLPPVSGPEVDLSTAAAGSSEAYVSVARTASDIPGIIVLGESIREHDAQRDFVVLVLPTIELQHRSTLCTLGFRTVMASFVFSQQAQQHLLVSVREDEFASFYAWGLTQYEAVLHLEPDVVVIDSLDPVFAAIKTTKLVTVTSDSPPTPFTMGMIGLQPSQSDMEALLQRAKAGRTGAEMVSIIEEHFGRGNRLELPFVYCVDQQHVSTLSELPATARAIHFTGPNKPWHPGSASSSSSSSKTSLEKQWRNIAKRVARKKATHCIPASDTSALRGTFNLTLRHCQFEEARAFERCVRASDSEQWCVQVYPYFLKATTPVRTLGEVRREFSDAAREAQRQREAAGDSSERVDTADPAGAARIKPLDDGSFVISTSEYTKQIPRGCVDEDAEHEISLAVQLGYNRLGQLVELASDWGGHISAAIFTTSFEEETAKILDTVQRTPRLFERMDLHVVSGSDSTVYPINFLRNVAYTYARTELFLVLDIDFLLSPHMREVLHSREYNHVFCYSKDRHVHIIPAFEMMDATYCHISPSLCPTGLPANKIVLKNTWDAHNITSFHPRSLGHIATNYYKWFATNDPYYVMWTKYYEPYLVVRKQPDLPPFDERFINRSRNKSTFVFLLFVAGYRFVVLPHVYVSHCNPDLTSLCPVKGDVLTHWTFSVPLDDYLHDDVRDMRGCAPDVRVCPRAPEFAPTYIPPGPLDWTPVFEEEELLREARSR